MYDMKTIKSLLLAGLIGTSGIVTGCGGGGGAATPSYWTIDVRADAMALPINIANEGPSIGGRYTTTLYVEVKDSAGRPISNSNDIIGWSYVGGLDSGPLYYLDGDPDHETTETIDDVEYTYPNAYRAVTLSPNSGLAYQRIPTATQREYLSYILDSFPKPEATPAREVLQQDLISPLTPRELDVLGCLAQGASNQAIAEELFITINSVKKHTGNIYRKLDAKSRTQAIARGRELGLIE